MVSFEASSTVLFSCKNPPKEYLRCDQLFDQKKKKKKGARFSSWSFHLGCVMFTTHPPLDQLTLHVRWRLFQKVEGRHKISFGGDFFFFFFWRQSLGLEVCGNLPWEISVPIFETVVRRICSAFGKMFLQKIRPLVTLHSNANTCTVVHWNFTCIIHRIYTKKARMFTWDTNKIEESSPFFSTIPWKKHSTCSEKMVYLSTSVHLFIRNKHSMLSTFLAALSSCIRAFDTPVREWLTFQIYAPSSFNYFFWAI